MNIQDFFDALKKVMPDVMDRMNSPATNEQIQKLKSLYDFEIDPLYIEFLQVCNGEKDTLMMGLGSRMQDIDRACTYHSTEWMNWFSIADNPHLCKDNYYSHKRVPIMEDGGGSIWFLDYDPAEEGKMGQVICVFRDQPEIIFNCFNSFEELIQTIIAEINAGKVSIDKEMKCFNYANANISYNFYANKSASYHKNKIEVPVNFFANLSAEWLSAVSNATHNPIINREGITAKSEEALAVKEIQIRDPKMMDTFVEVMQYLPNVMFLYFSKEITLSDEHYAIIKNLRLYSLTVHCPVRNIASLTNTNSLRILSLSRMYDANINEIADYKNLIKLDIQRKDDTISLAFLPKMLHLEELQLWHETPSEIGIENVTAIEKIPRLNNFSTFNTKNINFDNLVKRASPFYISVMEQVEFER